MWVGIKTVGKILRGGKIMVIDKRLGQKLLIGH